MGVSWCFGFVIGSTFAFLVFRLLRDRRDFLTPLASSFMPAPSADAWSSLFGGDEKDRLNCGGREGGREEEWWWRGERRENQMSTLEWNCFSKIIGPTEMFCFRQIIGYNPGLTWIAIHDSEQYDCSSGAQQIFSDLMKVTIVLTPYHDQFERVVYLVNSEQVVKQRRGQGTMEKTSNYGGDGAIVHGERCAPNLPAQSALSFWAQ